MSIFLQNLLIISSILFFLFIFRMVTRKKLELRYALTWMMTSFVFIVLSVFPQLLDLIAYLLHIKAPVNALFLAILFFLIVIVFVLTVAISRNANRVKTLTQEIGILKLQIEKLECGEKSENEQHQA